MNKLLKFITAFVLVITSTIFLNQEKIIENVYAYGDFSYGGRYIGDWNGHPISELYIDGQIVFCIEPGVLTPQSPEDYPGYSEDWGAIDWGERQRIGNWAYAHSKGLVSYVDAQIGIWSGSWYEGLTGKSPNLQPKENFELVVGKEVRYTDTTGLIAGEGYTVSNCGAGLECRIEGNDLVLKGVSKADNTSATVSKAGAGGEFWAVAWKKPGFQTVAMAGGSDPLFPETVRGIVKAREINVVKRDDFGVLVKEPHEFEISKDENFSEIFMTIVTDENGFANTGTIDNGTYYVREKDTGYGYECNNQVFTAVVNDDVVILDSKDGEGFINKLRNFKIKITKRDIENPEIILDNSKFEIYDVTDGEDKLISSFTTGEDGFNGTYTYDEAKYNRTYKVCEVEAPIGYSLDKEPCKTVTIDMKEGEEAKEVDFENEKTTLHANVSLRKIDDTYDDIKINGAEITLYDVTNKKSLEEIEAEGEAQGVTDPNKTEETEEEVPAVGMGEIIDTFIVEEYTVVTGNQYIRLVNPYNPKETLNNTEIIFYEDELLSNEIARATSDEKGLIIVSNIKELEKGKEYYYKLPAVTVKMVAYDLNSTIKVTPNTEVTFYSDEAMTQEVVKITSDENGIINVGGNEFEKSVTIKNACQYTNNTVTTKNEDVITESGEKKAYYYNLRLVGNVQKVLINNNQDGYANFDLQSGKKYEICETKLPDHYEYTNEKEACRAIDFTDYSIAKEENFEFEKEEILNSKVKINLEIVKHDSSNKEKVLNGAEFTFEDVTYADTNFNNILPYSEEYEIGEVLNIDDMTFVIYNFEDDKYYAINAKTRERFELSKDYTKNLDRSSINLGNQVSGQHIVYLTDYDPADNYDNFNVGDVIQGKTIIEKLAHGIFKLNDGTIVFKELNEKKELVGIKAELYSDIELTQKITELESDENGRIVINEKGKTYLNIPSLNKVIEVNVEDGKLNIEKLRHGSKIKVCEIKSPIGYLIGQVCETIEIKNEDENKKVINYKPNRRKKLIRKMGISN